MSIPRCVHSLTFALCLSTSLLAGEASKPARERFSGSPAEILKELEKTLKVEPNDDTPEGHRKALNQALEAILLGSEKVLSHPKATSADKTEAHQFQISALYQSARIGNEGAAQKLSALADSLKKTHSDQEVAPLAAYLSIKATHETPEGLSASAIPRVQEFIKNFPGDDSAIGLLEDIGRTTEMQGKPEDAKGAYKLIAASFPEHKATQSIEGVLRRLDLVGKPIELSAKTIDGKVIESKSLLGKVVIVDFWATWCGPCIAEFSRLKKLHREYQARGLEIIGVPLDEDRRTLDDFLASAHLDWPQLFFPAPRLKDAKANDPPEPLAPHPLAERYGVVAIPMMFLIDKNGVVMSTSLRGAALEKKIQELLGAEAKP